MMLARRIAPIAAVLLLAAACGGGAGGGPALSDDALSERLADYYQKSVSSPGVTFKVVKLEDAGMPGWRKGTMVASLGQQSQNWRRSASCWMRASCARRPTPRGIS